MTVCVLMFVGWGHMYVNGVGSVFYKRCTYECGDAKLSRIIPPHHACAQRMYNA